MMTNELSPVELAAYKIIEEMVSRADGRERELKELKGE